MKLHVRPSLRVLTSLCLVAVVLVGSGCRRAVRPEAGEDRMVEAGVPTRFGAPMPDAPVVTWDFGDGTPPQRTAVATHAFPRSGTYTVRALQGDEVLDTATVTVVPRPVLRAIPADAEVAVFFPRLRGNVEPLLRFSSRLLGQEVALASFREAPLLGLVLSELEGEPRRVDPEEGLGFFSLPGFNGTVGLMGVMDAQAALDAVVKDLVLTGATPRQGTPEGVVVLDRPEDEPLTLFADRGYLYLVIPDSEEPGEEESLAELAPPGEGLAPEVEAVRTRILGMSGPGLSELPLLTELKQKVGSGNVHFFARPVGEDDDTGIRGVWAAFRMEPGRAEVEGWVASEKPLFSGQQAPTATLLEKAPAGPIAALLVSVPPEDLAKLVFGSPGSERRERTLQRLQEQGFDAAGAEGLLGALKGNLAVLAYFDAPSFFRNFIRGSRRPEPRGTLLVEAGLNRAEPVVEWLTRRLQARGQPFEAVKGKDATRLRTRVMEQPVELSISPEVLTVRGGEALEGRPASDVGEALRERFGGDAFEAGHVSAMVDLGRLRAELEAPQEVPGVPSQQLPVAQSLVGAMLDQLPPIDLLFLDFTPQEGGGRFRARTVLRER